MEDRVVVLSIAYAIVTIAASPVVVARDSGDDRRCDPIAWGPVCTNRELTQSESNNVDGAISSLNDLGGTCTDLGDILDEADVYAFDEEVYINPIDRIEGQAFCENCNGSAEYSGQIHFYSGGDQYRILIHEAIHYYLNQADHTGDFDAIENACGGVYAPLAVAEVSPARRSIAPSLSVAWGPQPSGHLESASLPKGGS